MNILSIITSAVSFFAICFFDLVAIFAAIVFWIKKEKKTAISATYYAIPLTLLIIFCFIAPNLIPIPTLPLIIWNAMDCYNFVEKKEFKESIFSFAATLFFAIILVTL